MLTWLKESWRLRRLERMLRQLNTAHEARYQEAVRTKVPEANRHEMKMEYWADTDELVDDINDIRTARLLRKARKMLVPIPESDGSWDVSDRLGSRYLTTKGVHELRAAIRKEGAERRATWEFWIKLIGSAATAATGLGGVTIGILAYLSR